MTSSKKDAPPVRDHIGLYPAARPPAPTKTGGGNADNIRPLVYQLTIAEGDGETHADLNHPLAAPLKHGASTGKPSSGPWHYVCVRHPDGNPPTVIGAMMNTVGNRLLFFPGSTVNFGMTDSLGRFAGKRLDHLTLDPPKKGKWTSHMTLFEGNRREKHGLKNTATERPGFMLPWLTMFVPDLSGFHALPSKLTMSLDWPSSDLIRYARETIGTHYRQCAVVDAPPEPNGGGFWQVDFLVGQGTDWRERSFYPVQYVGGEEFVQYTEPTEGRVAGVMISELILGLGVIIIVTRPTGTVSGSNFITPPDEWFDK